MRLNRIDRQKHFIGDLLICVAFDDEGQYLKFSFPKGHRGI
jgi:hypothetical protein